MIPGFGLIAFSHHLGKAPTWMDVVTGYDYGFLERGDVQTWARAHAPTLEGHPACHRLATMDPDTAAFQRALWDACAEMEGSVSRVGHTRWIAASDRWRLALIRECLAGERTLEGLAVALEGIYDTFGCPDDMLALWERKAPWEKRLGKANLPALQAFLARHARMEQAA